MIQSAGKCLPLQKRNNLVSLKSNHLSETDSQTSDSGTGNDGKQDADKPAQEAW